MALRDQPYIPLYVQDFLTDEKLIECSASSTGVYIRLICIMHKSSEYGQILLKQKDKQTSEQVLNFAIKLSKQMPYPIETIKESLEELLSEEVLILQDDILIQKRMVKDNDISFKRSVSGKKGGKFAQAKIKANNKANSEYENEYVNEDINNPITKKEEVPLTREDRKPQRVKNFLEAFDLPLPFESEEFKNTWLRWHTHRKQIKKPLSAETQRTQLEKMAEKGETESIKAMKFTIEKGWQGLADPTTYGNSNNNNNTQTPVPNGKPIIIKSTGRVEPQGGGFGEL